MPLIDIEILIDEEIDKRKSIETRIAQNETLKYAVKKYDEVSF